METSEFSPEIEAFPKAYNDKPRSPKEFKKGQSALSKGPQDLSYFAILSSSKSGL